MIKTEKGRLHSVGKQYQEEGRYGGQFDVDTILFRDEKPRKEKGEKIVDNPCKDAADAISGSIGNQFAEETQMDSLCCKNTKL